MKQLFWLAALILFSLVSCKKDPLEGLTEFQRYMEEYDLGCVDVSEAECSFEGYFGNKKFCIASPEYARFEWFLTGMAVTENPYLEPGLLNKTLNFRFKVEEEETGDTLAFNFTYHAPFFEGNSFEELVDYVFAEEDYLKLASYTDEEKKPKPLYDQAGAAIAMDNYTKAFIPYVRNPVFNSSMHTFPDSLVLKTTHYNKVIDSLNYKIDYEIEIDVDDLAIGHVSYFKLLNGALKYKFSISYF